MKQRLGDILVAQGALDPLQLQAALAYQRTWGVPLGQVVVDQRFCSARQVLDALAVQTGLPAVDLDGLRMDAALARLVPLKVAEAHRVVPLRVEGPRDTLLVVAIAAPATLTSLDAVKSVSGKGRVTPHLATDAAITRAIRRLYHGEEAPAPGAQPTASITLPEADADMPFEVESWAAVANTAAPLRAPPAPAADGARPTPALFRPTGATPPPLPRRSGAFPAVPGEPARASGSHPAVSLPPGLSPTPAPFRAPAPASSPTPAPFRPPASASGSFPAVAAPARPSGTVPPVQAPAPAPGVRLLFYGWGSDATAGLLRALAAEGLPMQVASTADVLAADARAIVITPLPAMESVGQRVRAQLIVAGKAPEVDLARAQALGAKGFLAAPLDADLLLRAVRRLRKAAEEDAPKP